MQEAWTFPGLMLACCANHIYRALLRFLHGYVLDDLQELVENPVLTAHDGAAELGRSLGILLTGLTTILTRQAKPGRLRQYGTPPADPPFRRPGHE